MTKMTHDQRVLAHQRETADSAARAGFMRSTTIADNPIHRAMFALPPIKVNDGTGLAVPELPAQRIVTGDREVDAVIWLREVIGTGQPALIEKAKIAAKKIKTPFKDLEKRYTAHLARASGGNPFATLASMGFADLDDWEKRSIEMAARRDEARARFGDSLFENTAAETFAEMILAGVEPGVDKFGIDDMDNEEVDTRFDAALDQRPATLTDCLVELKFWSDLYWLRNAIDRDGSDASMQAQARNDYAFRCLARIRPRSTAEAHQVLQYLIDEDRMNWNESPDILRNLMTRTSAGAPAPAKRPDVVLRNLDGYLAASGYRADHPWRSEIAAALPEASAGQAWGLAQASAAFDTTASTSPWPDFTGRPDLQRMRDELMAMAPKVPVDDIVNTLAQMQSIGGAEGQDKVVRDVCTAARTIIEGLLPHAGTGVAV